MLKKIIKLLLVLGIFFWAQAEFVYATTPLPVTVEPTKVLMGAFYNGTTVSVTGDIPSDSEALIRLTGHLENSMLKQKGRALGILWMNLGDVAFHNIPSVFLLCPSKAVNALMQEGGESWLGLGLGMEAVRKKAEIKSASEDEDELFQEFVKLKQKKGLYGIQEGMISYKEHGSNMKSFSGTVTLPSTLPQGKYKIEVFAIKDNAVLGYEVKEIGAEESGTAAFISTLAFEHGTIYGVLAVLVAIFAGLLTGIMFKGEKGAH